MNKQCPQGLTDEQAEEYRQQVEGFLKHQNLNRDEEINQLKTQRDRLLDALEAAARSLKTIAELDGKTEFVSVRGYAKTRSDVAYAQLLESSKELERGEE